MPVAVITTKLQSLTLMWADEKLKTIMKWLRFIITSVDEHGSDAECLDLYHKQTWFWCSACIRAPETPKLGACASSAWTFIISEHDSDARIHNNSHNYIASVGPHISSFCGVYYIIIIIIMCLLPGNVTLIFSLNLSTKPCLNWSILHTNGFNTWSSL